MASETTEHFEVWYVEPDSGHERHQKADTKEQATEIAAGHTWDGMSDVLVRNVKTSVTTTAVKVDFPAERPAEVVDSTG